MPAALTSDGDAAELARPPPRRSPRVPTSSVTSARQTAARPPALLTRPPPRERARRRGPRRAPLPLLAERNRRRAPDAARRPRHHHLLSHGVGCSTDSDRTRRRCRRGRDCPPRCPGSCTVAQQMRPGKAEKHRSAPAGADGKCFAPSSSVVGPAAGTLPAKAPGRLRTLRLYMPCPHDCTPARRCSPRGR